jgi:putative SOS response-associated peptidase YedK
MCGRVVTTSSPEELSEYVGAAAILDVLDGPDHNVAPSGRLPIAWEDPTDGHQRLLGTARWGLVPQWATDPSIGGRMFNARSETVAGKPSFRAAFRNRRCLVPVDGFYEWSPASTGSPKQPWFVRRADGAPLAMAGLWEAWTDGEGSVLRTCTILTVEANADLAPIHHRMPALLPPGDWAGWLDPSTCDASALESLLVPAPAGLLERHPVDHRVNDARRKGAELTVPVADPTQVGGGAGQEALW